jgi:hypothetical protein
MAAKKPAFGGKKALPFGKAKKPKIGGKKGKTSAAGVKTAKVYR